MTTKLERKTKNLNVKVRMQKVIKTINRQVFLYEFIYGMNLLVYIINT